MINLVPGHTNHLDARIYTQIGGATLCRCSKDGGPIPSASGVLAHRAPRAGCLTGLRAGTPVSRSVYADSFAHRNIAPHSLPVATLRSPRVI